MLLALAYVVSAAAVEKKRNNFRMYCYSTRHHTNTSLIVSLYQQTLFYSLHYTQYKQSAAYVLYSLACIQSLALTESERVLVLVSFYYQWINNQLYKSVKTFRVFFPIKGISCASFFSEKKQKGNNIVETFMSMMTFMSVYGNLWLLLYMKEGHKARSLLFPFTLGEIFKHFFLAILPEIIHVSLSSYSSTEFFKFALIWD